MKFVHHTVLQPYLDRFGFSPALFSDYTFVANAKGVYIQLPQQQIPPNIDCDATGLFFLKTKMLHPKLSTQAVMLFGKHATKNVVVLDTRDDLEAYIRQQDVKLTDAQVQACTDTGYVILRYEGIEVGLGLYFSPNETHGPVLRSLFPKHWQGGA